LGKGDKKFLDSGYRGFLQSYFLKHEKEELALEANNSDSKKEPEHDAEQRL
jgi:hypothetical protein